MKSIKSVLLISLMVISPTSAAFADEIPCDKVVKKAKEARSDEQSRIFTLLTEEKDLAPKRIQDAAARLQGSLALPVKGKATVSSRAIQERIAIQSKIDANRVRAGKMDPEIDQVVAGIAKSASDPSVGVNASSLKSAKEIKTAEKEVSAVAADAFHAVVLFKGQLNDKTKQKKEREEIQARLSLQESRHSKAAYVLKQLSQLRSLRDEKKRLPEEAKALAKELASQDQKIEKIVDESLKRTLLAQVRKDAGLDESYVETDDHSVKLQYDPSTKAKYERYYTNGAEALSVQTKGQTIAVCKAFVTVPAPMLRDIGYNYCTRIELATGKRTEELSFSEPRFGLLFSADTDFVLSDKSARKLVLGLESPMHDLQLTTSEELAVCEGFKKKPSEPVVPGDSQKPAETDSKADTTGDAAIDSQGDAKSDARLAE